MAVIVVEPVFVDEASPFDPDVLLMVAIEVSEEFQVASEEISKMLESVNVPRAINCSVWPRTMLGLTGVTVIDERTGAVTVSTAGGLDVTLENEATMVVVP